ncbi:MAG: Glutamyl-tRNA(Gln) amidotransferase subunit, partial [Frankiales bacterium]|nr:Glutamyl-tRNA(Gln) amidotransferase subunit [Frankiales bacterium]
MNDEQIAFAGVTGQRALLRAGEITSVELLALSLRRIAELDPRLNAFKVLYDTAHAEAVAADERIA